MVFSRFKLVLVVLAVSAIELFGYVETKAGLIVKYDFFGDFGDEINEPPASNNPNVTPTALVRGPGVVPRPLASEIYTDGLNSSSWSTTGLDVNDYYQFSITTNSNTFTTLNNLYFKERRTASGIRNFQLRTSTNGFASFVNQGLEINVPDNGFQRDQAIALSGLSTLVGGTAVTFRLYGYNAEDEFGTWALFNHTTQGGMYLDGNVTVVPETSSLLLLAGPVGCLAANRRRRKQ